MANHALPAASRAGMSKKGCISCIGINAATKNEVEKHATMIVCVAERLEEEGYVTRHWPNRQSAIGQPHYITCSCLPFAQEAIASIIWKRHGHLLGCSAPELPSRLHSLRRPKKGIVRLYQRRALHSCGDETSCHSVDLGLERMDRFHCISFLSVLASHHGKLLQRLLPGRARAGGRGGRGGGA